MATKLEILTRVRPLFEDMDRRCTVADRFIDKDQWRIYLATAWSNLVIEPESLGLVESDLETAFEVIESEAALRLGGEDALVESFKFLTTKEGGICMDKAKLRKNHRDMLLYFASMMVDPERHKQYLEEIRTKS